MSKKLSVEDQLALDNATQETLDNVDSRYKTPITNEIPGTEGLGPGIQKQVS